MSTDEYVPSECEVRADFVQTHTRNFDSYLMGRSLTSEQEHYGAQFDAMIARVRRDAALTLAEHFSTEAIDQARQGNPDGADFYRAVATEIENQIPEETP